MASKSNGKNYIWIPIDNAPKMPEHIIHIAGEYNLSGYYDHNQEAILVQRNRKCTKKNLAAFLNAVFVTPENNY